MVLYLFDLDLEEECQRMQELNKNHFEGTTALRRREYPDESSDDTHSDRRTYDD